MDMLSDMGGSWQDKKYKQNKNEFLKFSIVTGPNIKVFKIVILQLGYSTKYCGYSKIKCE